jgi:type 2 lantibiotic biosynthesis protein LanM
MDSNHRVASHLPVNEVLRLVEQSPDWQMIRLVHEPVVEALEKVHECLVAVLHEVRISKARLIKLEASLLQSLLPQISQVLGRTTLLEIRCAQILARPDNLPFAEAHTGFLTSLSIPSARAAIHEHYPAIKTIVYQLVSQWTHHATEVLKRFVEDEQTICSSFNDNCRAIYLDNIDLYAGDKHRGGRAVSILSFASGQKLVYKPRSLSIDHVLSGFLCWLNSQGLAHTFIVARVVRRPDYGWVEYIAPTKAETNRGIEEFAQRLGALLAVMYVLGGRDFHTENLIFHKGYPVPLDLEVVLEPHVRLSSHGTYPRGDVTSTGILPGRSDPAGGPALDVSFLGYVEGQRTPFKIPRYVWSDEDNVHVVWDFGEVNLTNASPFTDIAAKSIASPVDAMVDGFKHAYNIFLQKREELLSDDGPLTSFGGLRTRVVLRPTVIYSELLRESFHPDLLQENGRHERFLDRIGEEVTDGRGVPANPAFIAEERRQLGNYNIPYFEANTIEPHILGEGGEALEGVDVEPGLALTRTRIETLSLDDQQLQSMLIRNSFATYGRSKAVASNCTAVELNRSQLMQEIELIGGRLIQLGDSGGSDLSFVQIDLDEFGTCVRRPVDLSLYNGLAGICVSLAQMGSLLDSDRILHAAYECTAVLRSSLGSWASPDIGAFTGWGGILYALCQLRAIFSDQEIDADIDYAFRAGSAQMRGCKSADLVSGSAGWISSLYACREVLDARAVRRQAVSAEMLLRSSAQRMEHGVAWAPHGSVHPPLGGLSHGTAGIALGLSRGFEITGGDGFASLCRDALRYDRSLFNSQYMNWEDLRYARRGISAQEGLEEMRPPSQATWCHGAPGVGVSRLCLSSALADKTVEEEIITAARTTTAIGMPGSHCLCHGWLGNVDFLLELERAGLCATGVAAGSSLLRDLLSSFREKGWICGGVRGDESVGLMTGLAGIAYELLRFGFPNKVPSILALQPPVW